MVHVSEIIVILAVVLLLFGTGKFPKIMQNFAEGIKSFKKAMNEKDDKKGGNKNKKNAPKKSSSKVAKTKKVSKVKKTTKKK